MTLRGGPYEHLRTDAVFDALEELERRGDPANARSRLAPRRSRKSLSSSARAVPSSSRPALAALANPLTAADRDALSAVFARMKPEEILEAYVAAVRAKDVESYLALYADDVRTFDLWSVWTYDGKDAFRAMVEEWFGSQPDNVDRRSPSNSTRCAPRSATDVAAVSAFTTFRGLDARRQRGAIDEQPPHVDSPARRRRVEDRPRAHVRTRRRGRQGQCARDALGAWFWAWARWGGVRLLRSGSSPPALCGVS